MAEAPNVEFRFNLAPLPRQQMSRLEFRPTVSPRTATQRSPASVIERIQCGQRPRCPSGPSSDGMGRDGFHCRTAGRRQTSVETKNLYQNQNQYLPFTLYSPRKQIISTTPGLRKRRVYVLVHGTNTPGPRGGVRTVAAVVPETRRTPVCSM